MLIQYNDYTITYIFTTHFIFDQFLIIDKGANSGYLLIFYLFVVSTVNSQICLFIRKQSCGSSFWIILNILLHHSNTLLTPNLFLFIHFPLFTTSSTLLMFIQIPLCFMYHTYLQFQFHFLIHTFPFTLFFFAYSLPFCL